MFNMQGFYKWLSTPTPKKDFYQFRLASLTRIDRTRILNVTNQSQWYLWSEV